MQDESASVQVYVLNPCLVPIPRQMDQYLILTAACDHLLVAPDGSLVNGRASQPFVAKCFQVQVPAGLNLQHRSVTDFASKGCTTLKLRPREAGVARLKVRISMWGHNLLSRHTVTLLANLFICTALTRSCYLDDFCIAQDHQDAAPSICCLWSECMTPPCHAKLIRL